MYILQAKGMVGGWADIEEKESAYDLTEKYKELVHRGRSIDNLRIVKTVAVEVNTTVEVVK